MDQMQREKPVGYLYALWIGVGLSRIPVMHGETPEDKLAEMRAIDADVYQLRLVRGTSKTPEGDGRSSGEIIPLY